MGGSYSGSPDKQTWKKETAFYQLAFFSPSGRFVYLGAGMSSLILEPAGFVSLLFLSLWIFFFVFLRQVSLCTPGYLETNSIDHTGL